MVRYTVDCCLKEDVLALIIPMLHEIGDEGNMDPTATFQEILVRTVTRRLQKLEEDELLDREHCAYDFLLNGQGAVSLASTPTKAQESFIRSLVKVVMHDFATGGNNQVIDYQGNLLISFCIEKLYIEKATGAPSFGVEADDLVWMVADALGKGQKLQTMIDHARGKEFDINFYATPERFSISFASAISDEFDKIDLKDDESGHERTLTPLDPSISWLPFSPETFQLVRVHFLPSREYEGAWEALYFDDDIKGQLFNYATIALKMSHFIPEETLSVNTGGNRLLLVHGPPGTGKTTICKALCHKLAIRLHSGLLPKNKSVPSVILVELACSKVFSRWFGESSKNIDTIFKDLEKLIKDGINDNQFVCLLIDEVETIAFSRSSLINKNETTDAIRVVNTLLTQLDNMKKYKNFLTLATSNLLDSMDPAFIDRADGIFNVPTPSTQGCQNILELNISKLLTAGVIHASKEHMLYSPVVQAALQPIVSRCADLRLSGRTMGKLPLKALSENFTNLPVDLKDFIVALASVI
ncbi:AEL258Wp [Eremothecium gossypii ATCC 10895]|uniref:AEL258Wp n=1 Tax=Eremothecium gossypii (strain ATCC 10895 / CBS 109.51 / FGSC 9923 / NRRL Y-1056) TaxID=284811 RepID=Q758L9_EREGS|nr:AEL258Wp [Eremothecium gossypii ATCC 10895]AAS52427.2 AEL258Wp [Eremothecium gossypii ATCC 10895]